jgi:addiction module RelE/StbE family toxin
MKIIWSPLALERVEEIAKYIAQDKPMAAENWIENIFAKVGQLRNAPETGRIVPETNKTECRELLYGNYRIIYRIEMKQISVLTVRHGMQILPVKEIRKGLE